MAGVSLLRNVLNLFFVQFLSVFTSHGGNNPAAKSESEPKSRPDLYSSKLDGSPKRIAGKPLIPCFSHNFLPLPVQSASATTTVAESTYSSINLDHAGAIALQWPHHLKMYRKKRIVSDGERIMKQKKAMTYGANILMNTVFPSVISS